MNLKNLGSQMLKIRINDNDIKEGMIGVMGDTNARNFRVNIVAENNEVLADSSISLKLFVKQGDTLLVTDGNYNNDGTYTVNLPNEVFIEEQTLECQIMIEKADERLFSTVFNKKVERGLLGTVREGRTTSIDLLKAIEFGDTYTEKMKALEDLANDKNLLLIRTADSKLNEYNNNHELKTGLLDSHINRITGEVENYIMRYRDSYNNLFEKHTAEFNSNSDSKLQEYNSNAENKTSILSNIQSDVTEKYASINQTAENINGSKSDFDSKKIDFDNKYDGITDIVHAENERVQAENLRQQHDERIQRLLNDGLNSELGEYVKKENIVDDLTTGGSDKALSAEQGKVLFQSVSNGKQLIASAITDRGVQTEAISEFSVMAENIKSISSSGGVISDDDKLKIKRITNYLINAFNNINKCGVNINTDALNSESLIKTDGNIDLNELERRVIILRNASSKILDYSQVIHDSIKDYLSGKIVYNEQNITPIIGGPLHWLMCLTYTAMPND